MMPWKNYWALLALAALSWAGTLRAQPGDPVEELRQALKAPILELEDRDQTLTECTERLQGLTDLARALVLQEWRDLDLSREIAQIDRTQRSKLAERFEQGVKQVFEQGNRDASIAVLDVLAELGENVPPGSYASEVAKLTLATDPQVSAVAARTLGLIQADPAVALPALTNLLEARSAPLRQAAAQGLVCLLRKATQPAGPHKPNRCEIVAVGQAVVPPAARALDDVDPEVRRHCATIMNLAAAALSQLDRQAEGDDTLPLIVAFRDQGKMLALALGDWDAEVRYPVLQALADLAQMRLRLGRRASQPVENEDDPLLEALRPALPLLADAVADPDAGIRLSSLDVLEALGPAAASAMPAVVIALADPDKFVRWSAARALSKMGPADQVVPHLAKALLETKDLDAGLATAAALENFGPEAWPAVPALTEALTRPSVEMRLAALRALTRIDAGRAKPAIAALCQALTDADPRVRQMAALTLGKFASPSALPALRQARSDSDPEVQKAVRDAILLIAE